MFRERTDQSAQVRIMKKATTFDLESPISQRGFRMDLYIVRHGIAIDREDPNLLGVVRRVLRAFGSEMVGRDETAAIVAELGEQHRGADAAASPWYACGSTRSERTHRGNGATDDSDRRRAPGPDQRRRAAR